jgi:hypothetical protein
MGQQNMVDFEDEEEEEKPLQINRRMQMKGIISILKVLTLHVISRQQHLQEEVQILASFVHQTKQMAK